MEAGMPACRPAVQESKFENVSSQIFPSEKMQLKLDPSARPLLKSRTKISLTKGFSVQSGPVGKCALVVRDIYLHIECRDGITLDQRSSHSKATATEIKSF